MNKLIYILLFIVILFGGCSSRQYFEPEDTYNFKEDTKNLDSDIIDLNSDGATLEDFNYISKEGILENSKTDYKFLNYKEDTILASDNNATLYIKGDDIDKTVSFDRNIISASKLGRFLAFGTNDNAITLYDLDKEQILFKEYLKSSVINNIKIANPIFLNNLVLYPTLDGKVVIVDIKTKSVVKTLNIDPDGDVNNIIFLEQIDDSLIAATTKKIFSFVNGIPNIKEIDVQNIILQGQFIYVATLDGKIIKYNKELQEIASKKFKFAKFHALAIGEYLYALESQEYLIQLDKEFNSIKIYDFSFDNEEKVIGIENKIYFEDEYIILK